jgi:putative DNA primase/helicase
LRSLVNDPAKARDAMKAMRDTIAAELADANAAGQVRRVAERFALVAAAGELATASGLTGWNNGEATRATQVCFAAWLDVRGTSGGAEPAAMLEQVRGFLSAHGEARFTDWTADDHTPRTNNRVGFRRQGESGPVYYIEAEAFRREVCSGFDAKAVAKALADVGALKADSDGRSTRKERLPDNRSARVYVITPALWGDA